ncbi:MAG TPA: sulfite exporter TauE/SafE family protein, partial [Pyrinomonadaceae bacterium]|nr:sulfite exporter TauE/SafE family protein [Pyrinomonadaceae bacterium]
DPKVANATSTVALWPGLFGGLWGFRREIENSRSILVRLGATSVVGGGIGAWLLILTPSATFAYLVPFLILFATGLFTLQAPITRWLGTEAPAERPRARWWLGAMVFQFFSSIYGGYFGAGNGILMLAALGLLGLSDIHRANGIKNYLGICINFVAILSFSLARLVYWPDALLMAVAAIAGGYFGASTARRLGRVFVRRAVVLIGLLIGAVMLWRLKR